MKDWKPWGYAAHGPSFHGKDHGEIQDICRVAGFSGVEGHMQMFPDPTHSTLARVGDSYRTSGVPFTTFHLPYYSLECGIAAFYEANRRRAVDIAKRWMENAAVLGMRVMIQHPTTNGADLKVEGFERFLVPLGKSLDDLLPFAESLGVILMGSRGGLRG